MTKKTVLVVDDSASLRHVLTDLLTGGGYNVIEGENGQDALAKSHGKPVHLILCDVNMPIMDGIAFVAAYKSQPNCEDIPVVMLTTEADKTLKVAAKEAGARAWIVKPFNNEQLLNAVAKLIL